MRATGRHACFVMVFGLSLGVAPAWAQVVERDRTATVTGPRGRSITRSIQTERGPGFADRQVTVTRPGGTFQSNTAVQRGFSGVRPGSFPGPRGVGPGWGGRPVFVQRNVVVNSGVPLGPALVGGAGLFGLGMLAGSAVSAPPPPPPVVVYNPPPVYVQGPAPIVVATPAPQPPVVVVDEVALAAQRLKSWHESSRSDAAGVLGRLRDPRAIPPLLDRLRNDHATSVRVASATALGEIGDPRAIPPLEKVTVYDKRQEVRDAATMAVGRIQQLQAAASVQNNAHAQNLAPRENWTPARSRPASPSQSRSSGTPLSEDTAEQVPPPPTPADLGGSGIR